MSFMEDPKVVECRGIQTSKWVVNATKGYIKHSKFKWLFSTYLSNFIQSTWKIFTAMYMQQSLQFLHNCESILVFQSLMFIYLCCVFHSFLRLFDTNPSAICYKQGMIKWFCIIADYHEISNCLTWNKCIRYD